MKNFWITVFILAVLGIVGFFVYKHLGGTTTKFSAPISNNQINTTTSMTISSPQFLYNQAIPKQYTCDGQGVNPPLQFSNVPSEAKSLALVVEDPDAASGTWIHWLMW